MAQVQSQASPQTGLQSSPSRDAAQRLSSRAEAFLVRDSQPLLELKVQEDSVPGVGVGGPRYRGEMTRNVRPSTRFVLVGSWEECAAWASRAQLDLKEWAHLEPVGVGPTLRVFELRDEVDQLAERLAAERRERVMAVLEVHEDDTDFAHRVQVPGGLGFDAQVDWFLADMLGRDAADSRVTRSEGETTDGLRFWSGMIGRHMYTITKTHTADK